MDNLTDLKAIWHTAKTDSLPTSDEMKQIVKNFRWQKLRNKWITIICATLLTIQMITILCVVNFKFLSTYIGGAFMVVSGLILAYTNIRSLKRFYQLDDNSNIAFLSFIEQTRQNQIYYYKKTQVIIMLFSSVGLSIYLYEAVARKPLLTAIVYIVSLIYFAILWFVIRPRYFKKNTKKLNATKLQLEKILNQLK